jgi:hypothetical protein
LQLYLQEDRSDNLAKNFQNARVLILGLFLFLFLVGKLKHLKLESGNRYFSLLQDDIFLQEGERKSYW